MTYCVGMLLDTGLVFLSDSRTSAGVDQIGTFRKTIVFEQPGERVLVLQTSGNLAVSQAAISILRERMQAGGDAPNLNNVRSLFDAARCVGEALREVYRNDAEALRSFAVDFNAALLLGGQIAGEAPRLFSIYAAGNFIEATPDTTYFQIGESKYGKPIIDRVIRRSSSLNQAAKAALISMDSTIRSNLSVGLPLDLVIVRRDQLRVARHVTIGEDNAYFSGIRDTWSEALRHAFAQLPEPDWLKAGP
ncbi:MAG TPA: proteasome-type protease [Steroidobacteraceae bacterium]|nr:proteasome-type protease [Steroidobacteraceae bacterium]